MKTGHALVICAVTVPQRTGPCIDGKSSALLLLDGADEEPVSSHKRGMGSQLVKEGGS